ncbi:hypothetical protein KY306_00105 [Candidatus Woesearchaeota archaeon]|nr:hypothetical protein [Candidatus Woesearchaeota archaeon]
MASFLEEVILKPTGLWGMLTCSLGAVYALLEPLSRREIPDDYLLYPALFTAGFVFSYLMYHSNSEQSSSPTNQRQNNQNTHHQR